MPRSHSSLAMTFFSLTAPQGERSDHACTGIAEPKGRYTAGVESTVCRGMLSELNLVCQIRRRNSLNPLYVVECFRRCLFMLIGAGYCVLIHCMSWNAFGVVTKNSTKPTKIVLIHCMSWNAFGEEKKLVEVCGCKVLIHCMSWNAFGGWHRRGLINQGFQRAFFCQTF